MQNTCRITLHCFVMWSEDCEKGTCAQGKGEMSWIVNGNLECREWEKDLFFFFPPKMHFHGSRARNKMKRKSFQLIFIMQSRIVSLRCSLLKKAIQNLYLCNHYLCFSPFFLVNEHSIYCITQIFFVKTIKPCIQYYCTKSVGIQQCVYVR